MRICIILSFCHFVSRAIGAVLTSSVKVKLFVKKRPQTSIWRWLLERSRNHGVVKRANSDDGPEIDANLDPLR